MASLPLGGAGGGSSPPLGEAGWGPEPEGLPLVYIFAKIKNKIHKYHVRIKKYAKKRKKHPIIVIKGQNILSKKNNQVNLQFEINTKIHKQ